MEFQGLHNLVAPIGARRPAKRLGRGESSGLGKTSGRGHKGQKARKSGNVRIGFEGGQNPLIRRLPKRGFKNADFRKVFRVINLDDIVSKCDTAALVDSKALIAAGLMSHEKQNVKVLANGELKGRLNLRVHAVSKAAKEKIEGLGGTVELLLKS